MKVFVVLLCCLIATTVALPVDNGDNSPVVITVENVDDAKLIESDDLVGAESAHHGGGWRRRGHGHGHGRGFGGGYGGGFGGGYGGGFGGGYGGGFGGGFGGGYGGGFGGGYGGGYGGGHHRHGWHG